MGVLSKINGYKTYLAAGAAATVAAGNMIGIDLVTIPPDNQNMFLALVAAVLGVFLRHGINKSTRR